MLIVGRARQELVSTAPRARRIASSEGVSSRPSSFGVRRRCIKRAPGTAFVTWPAVARPRGDVERARFRVCCPSAATL